MSQSKSGANDFALMDALAKGAEEVRAQSARLKKSIQALQDWFGNLEGAVQAAVEVPKTDDHPAASVILAMPLRKLYVSLKGDTSLTNATDASLRLKIAVIEAAPKLLALQQEHQRKLIDRLAGANARFDEFAEQIGLTIEEGE
ncbi:MAG: hypothetical protein IH830_06830 [Planctomycetes bacterium]|nr:hypothetical protein [Planctomycetota bacterium]